MFRAMRRIRQQLEEKECMRILENNTHGILALSGDDGYPYAVPLSYVYSDGRIIFHSARKGHKIDSINRNAKASFCVVDRDDVIPEEYTTAFMSVIAFGKISFLNDGDARSAIRTLAEKYHPLDSPEGRERAIDDEWNGVSVFALDIEHITGKQGKALM